MAVLQFEEVGHVDGTPYRGNYPKGTGLDAGRESMCGEFHQEQRLLE
jgi:hypothetical protein